MYRVAVCDDNREILNEIGRMLEDTTEEISDVDLYASAQELENIYTEHGQRISLELIRPLFWSSLLVRISWMPLWARRSGN